MQNFLASAALSLKKHYRPEEIRQLAYSLLEDCCGFSKNEIYAGKDTKISAKQREELEQKLKRLAKGEPLQYITELAYFHDLKLAVNPDVLIPRPETEELVEWIIRDYAGRKGKILDVGTGSACIALALAKHLPGMQVEAWDISLAALALARKNATDLKLKVEFTEQDLFRYSPVPEVSTYDIIVSNPPYVTTAEALKMEKRVLDYEPAMALFVPDDDPLVFYRALAGLAVEILSPRGSLYVEISTFFGKETVQLFVEAGFKEVVLRQDLSGRDRMIKASKYHG